MKQKQKILFGMAHAGFFRNFETVIKKLLEMDIDVHVHFSKDHETIKINDYSLPANTSGCLTISISHDTTEIPIPAEYIRTLRNIIHYSRFSFRKAIDLRRRFFNLQKARALSEEKQVHLQKIFDFIPGFIKKIIDWRLSQKEKKIPPSQEAIELIKKIKPDYVIVTPYINFSSKEIDLVKAAHNEKIATLLATASWDNLTNKGRIMVNTTHVAVWNKAMAREARKLHQVPKRKIWITGAHLFDDWFTYKPSRDRKTFCYHLKFDPAQLIIVYLCSSEGIAGKKESDIVRRWRKAIRNSGHSQLINANILIRPHPMALRGWHDLLPEVNNDIGKLWKSKIWPLHTKHPTTDQGRADFFDTLYYADAIVGLNTSAMIEAAILRKPVLTFLDHGATISQTGNLHFKHLINGKFVIAANDLQQHIQQLKKVLKSPQTIGLACDKFIKKFVRPFGREVEASTQFVSQVIKHTSPRAK